MASGRVAQILASRALHDPIEMAAAGPVKMRLITAAPAPPEPAVPRKMRIWKMGGRWIWDCTLCHPGVQGSTSDWDRTLANARRHCERSRRYHHQWVRAYKGTMV